jgi:hypothetical protein
VTSGFDPQRWQPVLDHEAALFDRVIPGAAVALVGRSDWDAGSGRMLEWRADESGCMIAAMQPWKGLACAKVDVVLVGADEAFLLIVSAPRPAVMRALREGIRRGDIILFVTKCETGLRGAGFEDLLESLGLAFMGACR